VSRNTDYRSVEVPEGKDPEEYHYTERRAEILTMLEGAAHPSLVNGARLAERYDCTRQNIYNDFDKLSAALEDTGGSRESLEGESLHRWAIREFVKNDDPRGALDAFHRLSEWRRQGDLEDLLERVEALEREERESESPFRVK